MSTDGADEAAATQSAPAPGGVHQRGRRDWLEIVAVVLLSAIAVITAWCGFQSSKWGGEMSISFSQASAARVKASDAASAGRDQRQIDLTVFATWLTAVDSGDTELAAFVEQRFPPTLAAAFEAWDRKTLTPFALPEYVIPKDQEAAELSAQADAAYDRALADNQRGDNYTLLTVLFALVLFLAAIASRDGPRWARWTLLGLAMALAVTGLVLMLTFPVDL
ncbi:hypothetical protein [Microbacterium sp. BK668]|uniref:hypothetical protein n=1 Tax=Microbacterium sp. BK668 TaxID=2512118 RepID=UPI0010EC8FA4|nr:hypothetical protein [Microbacterium sp. BK668]TDN88657.1 hypothetical protein EV279_3102 [Microbacterium sp. BK668]